jgi:DNA polymerase III subunit delta
VIIFIYGDDALRVKERAEDMRQKFVEKFDPAGMNLDEFTVRASVDTERGAVMGAAQASPFLSEKRMVIIRGLVSTLKKADAKPWVEGFARVPSSTIVIFADVVAATTLEKAELFKALKAIPDVHTYPLPQLEGSELTSWTKQRAALHQADLSTAMLSLLLSRTGSDSWRIDAELQKLAAYAHGTPIDQDMIMSLVPADAQEDIFAFLDALATGQPAKVLAKLASERQAGTDDFQIFGMLTRQIRLLLQARSVLDSNPQATKQTLAETLSVHPFVAQKLFQETRSWSAQRLERLHTLAFTLDRSLKSGLASDVSVDRLVTAFLDK